VRQSAFNGRFDMMFRTSDSIADHVRHEKFQSRELAVVRFPRAPLRVPRKANLGSARTVKRKREYFLPYRPALLGGSVKIDRVNINTNHRRLAYGAGGQTTWRRRRSTSTVRVIG